MVDSSPQFPAHVIFLASDQFPTKSYFHRKSRFTENHKLDVQQNIDSVSEEE